ncbi:hypothetical protein BVX98_00360 [bacterium F11]|nr:hypothetical protein BVX98_00360 [bacterium F11]
MRLTLLGVLLLGMGCASSQKIYFPARRMVVGVPVANVRSEPVPHNGEYQYDPLQETQIEKGEPVLVWEKKGKWFRVEAPEQLEFTHRDEWEGYPGWVKAESLSTDLLLYRHIELIQLPVTELREKILEKASLHLGAPYLWGGRSLYEPEITDTVTGVDCSGLVNWSFRQVGWIVPRDAHEQYMRAKSIEPKELKPADLIFLAKPNKPDRMVHVMFYEGNEKILEAPQSGEKVRRISIQDRFGKSLSELKNGVLIQDRLIFFGSYFSEDK